MVIQTLAENAIKHGIASVRGAGRISILARSEGGRARVSVEDSGLGFDKRIDAESLPEPSGSGGYGLKNVQERLRAHFGPKARLHFERDSAAATRVVSFEIPVAAREIA
jgi:LytS/YehU family sensor histidine kinase